MFDSSVLRTLWVRLQGCPRTGLSREQNLCPGERIVKPFLRNDPASRRKLQPRRAESADGQAVKGFTPRRHRDNPARRRGVVPADAPRAAGGMPLLGAAYGQHARRRHAPDRLLPTYLYRPKLWCSPRLGRIFRARGGNNWVC